MTKETTTLYASDRDVFLFLVDDLNPIEAGLLPDGSPDLYFRGFYCWNSEVGAKTLGIASFYLRAVCQNRNLWGVEDFKEIKIRHSKYAASRFAHEAAPALKNFANSSPAPFIDGTPSKPIGPVYTEKEAALAVSDHGWQMVQEATGGMRRIVPSPMPLRIIGLDALKVLLDAEHIVICAGGGGIPVIRNASGDMEGVEAVIDKDRTPALLALGLDADALLLLTDVPAVYRDFGAPSQSAISTTTPTKLANLDLPPGSMGPKVAAAVAFATTSGKLAGIGQLTDARAIIEGRAGTRVMKEKPEAWQSATDETLAQQPVVSAVRGKQ